MKCDASEELTTSTFLMPDWYSWLMRWNTRSDPDRSTSIWMFGYSARKALAINSATLTSIDEYHTTLPSLAAAASIAGVVSWPAAGAAIAQASSAIGNVLMPQFHFIHLIRVSFFPSLFQLVARPRHRSALNLTLTFDPSATERSAGAAINTSCPTSTI